MVGIAARRGSAGHGVGRRFFWRSVIVIGCRTVFRGRMPGCTRQDRERVGIAARPDGPDRLHGDDELMAAGIDIAAVIINFSVKPAFLARRAGERAPPA